MNNKKTERFNVTNNLYIKDCLEVGTCIYNVVKTYEQGNITFDKTILENKNFRYAPTSDDKLVTVETSGTDPLLPWNVPVISPTEEVLNDFFLGLGYGTYKIYRVAEIYAGDGQYPVLADEKNGRFEKNRLRYQVRYPFDGYIYPGQLVSLTADGIVEPTQIGRGIPYYFDRFLPSDTTLAQPYGSYGDLTPYPADGIDSISPPVVGVALSDDTHKGPHSIAPEANNGFHSPGPNMSGTYYAPWLQQYAYGPNEKIPVLTKGIASVLIGAMTNIALMAYPQRVNGRWITIPCIPLFQGEKIHAGSAVYSACKAHAITGGAFSFTDVERDPASWLQKDINLSYGVMGQTPWDPWVDATWGNWGWTSTPGISFEYIPDTEVGIGAGDISGITQSNRGTVILTGVTTRTLSPSLGNSFLYSTQSREINNVELILNTLTISDQRKDYTNVYAKLEERAEIEEISGRGTLVQSVPERSQRIGTLLETIEGTGKWSYTGQLVGDPYNYDSRFLNGGIRYGSFGTADQYVVVGAPSAATVTYGTITDYPPDIGVLPDTVTLSSNAGFVVDDIINIVDNNLSWHYTQYDGINASYQFDGVDTWNVRNVGTNYGTPGIDPVFAEVHPIFNISKNNEMFFFSDNGGTLEYSGTNTDTEYFKDYTRYSVGTVVKVIGDTGTTRDSRLAYFIIESMEEGVPVLAPFKTSTAYPAFANLYCNTEIWTWDSARGQGEISSNGFDTWGGFLYYFFEDYGCGHEEGDRCLVYSNTSPDDTNNCVIEYPGLPPGAQEIIATGPAYSEDLNPYFDALTWDDIPHATLITLYTDRTAPLDTIPIIGEFSITSGVGTITYGIQYSGPTGPWNVELPWYHGNCLRLTCSSDGETLERLLFGPAPSRLTNLPTFNMTANPLRVHLDRDANGIVFQQSANIYNDVNMQFDASKYTFDAVNGTIVTVLYADRVGDECKLRLTSWDEDTKTLTFDIIQQGGIYGTVLGSSVYQTQREDQVNPMVNITVRPTLPNNELRNVFLQDVGVGNTDGDIMYLPHPDFTTNQVYHALFKYENNLSELDLPPYASVPGFFVPNDDDAWDKYSDVMKSAVNLLDRRVLIEMGESIKDEAECPTLPTASIGGPRAPPTNDIFRWDYDN